MKKIFAAGLLTLLMSTSAFAGAADLERLIDRVEQVQGELMDRSGRVDAELLERVFSLYEDVRGTAASEKLPPFPDTAQDFQRLAIVDLNLVKSELHRERQLALTAGY